MSSHQRPPTSAATELQKPQRGATYQPRAAPGLTAWLALGWYVMALQAIRVNTRQPKA